MQPILKKSNHSSPRRYCPKLGDMLPYGSHQSVYCFLLSGLFSFPVCESLIARTRMKRVRGREDEGVRGIGAAKHSERVLVTDGLYSEVRLMLVVGGCRWPLNLYESPAPLSRTSIDAPAIISSNRDPRLSALVSTPRACLQFRAFPPPLIDQPTTRSELRDTLKRGNKK